MLLFRRLLWKESSWELEVRYCDLVQEEVVAEERLAATVSADQVQCPDKERPVRRGSGRSLGKICDRKVQL